jgi:hypothetical protein
MCRLESVVQVWICIVIHFQSVELEQQVARLEGTIVNVDHVV